MSSFGRKMLAAACAALPLLTGAAALAQFNPVSAEQVSAEERSAMKRLLSTETDTKIISAALLQPNHIDIKPSRKGDPMAIPFLVETFERAAVVERMEKAYTLGNNEETLRFARYLAETFPSTKEASRARDLIDLLTKPTTVLPEKPENPTKDEFPMPDLPSQVMSETRTILYDSESPMIQVGFDFYREGQALRDWPNVVVKEIKPGEVVYRVTNEYAYQDFTVTLRGQ
jgi:hypothetical protein